MWMRCSRRLKSTFDGYVIAARWASHVFGKVPSDYFEAESFDQHFMAFGAVGVFKWVSGHVSDVYVVESNLA